MIKDFINKIEKIADKKIFIKTKNEIVDNYISKISKSKFIGEIPKSLKMYLTTCSVESFYEFENENIIIRFNNTNDIIKENSESFFLEKGFFIFADNSNCDIYLLDISKQGDSEVYLGSWDLFDDNQEIVFYKDEIIKIAFNYENIKKMSIKIADNFDDFIFNIINERNMKYDVVQFVINRYIE